VISHFIGGQAIADQQEARDDFADRSRFWMTVGDAIVFNAASSQGQEIVVVSDQDTIVRAGEIKLLFVGSP
jgi:hypothetical protein